MTDNNKNVTPDWHSYRVKVVLRLEIFVITGESSNIFRGPLLIKVFTLVSNRITKISN